LKKVGSQRITAFSKKLASTSISASLIVGEFIEKVVMLIKLHPGIKISYRDIL
jgi:hypothetical protein